MEDEVLVRHVALRLVLTLILFARLCPTLAEETRSPHPLAEAIPALLEQSAEQSGFVSPDLTRDELHELAEGRSMVRVSSPRTGAADVSAVRLLGFQIVDAPRLLVWLSVLGGVDEPKTGFTRVMLSRLTAGAYVRYQHVNLPWPFRDRHWVILCEKNLELAQESEGIAWQHRWSLHQQGEKLLRKARDEGRIGGLTRKELDESVYLPSNRGAWMLLELAPRKTLVVAHLDVELGGPFPNRLVTAFAKRELRAGLASLEELSNGVHLRYDERPMVHDGHGRPISRQAALDAAYGWTHDPRLARTE